MAATKSGEHRSGARGGAQPGGALFVVATPIGNLGDLGARAVEVLESVDLILAEDTRVSAKLLAHFGIATPCRSFHEHNETRQVARMVERIAAGGRLALISDAGTPLINDPGFRLVSALRERDCRVVPIPGPSAVVSALSVAGLPTDRFCFEGFLPAKAGARRRTLQALADEGRTLVFFESPRRLLATLGDLVAEFGAERPAVLARELTKIHETVIGSTLAELRERIEAHAEQRRGECVLVVAGAARNARGRASAQVDTQALLRVLVEELPLKQAVAITARVSGIKRNLLYPQALALSRGAKGADGAQEEE